MISSVLTVSTGHVTLNDNTVLQESKALDGIPVFTKYNGGWMLYNPRDEGEFTADIKEAGLSAYAVNLITYAFFTLKVDYLMIDMDGDTLKEFPVFDW